MSSLRAVLAGCVSVLLIGVAVRAEEAAVTTNVPATVESKGAENMVIMKTSKGDIKIELNAEKAPVTVKNFLSYVDDKFYDGTIFHRVINGFMIQGGGFTAQMSQKGTKAPIVNEASNGLKNDRGTIAMARTGDPNSATAQFFINVVNNDGLNRPSPDGHGYCVFGKVVEGLDVVDAIKAAATTVKAGMRDVPAETITILEVRRAAK
jgi:peptidyl-prolyl cis-trans isomerase A (cyclophilin A)